VMQRELGRLLTTVAESGTRIVCATGGRLADLRELTAALRRRPGFAFAALKRPSARDLRRILTGTAAETGAQPQPAAWRTIAASSRGDVPRAVGALTRYGFVQSLRPARSPELPLGSRGGTFDALPKLRLKRAVAPDPNRRGAVRDAWRRGR
jgi:chromosomal replication initiation ATPase DnaA